VGDGRNAQNGARRETEAICHPQPGVVASRLRDISADLASAGTPIAATRIGNRVALPQAMALGLGVIENAGVNPAAAEISALAEEIRWRALGLHPAPDATNKGSST